MVEVEKERGICSKGPLFDLGLRGRSPKKLRMLSRHPTVSMCTARRWWRWRDENGTTIKVELSLDDNDEDYDNDGVMIKRSRKERDVESLASHRRSRMWIVWRQGRWIPRIERGSLAPERWPGMHIVWCQQRHSLMCVRERKSCFPGWRRGEPPDDIPKGGSVHIKVSAYNGV